MNVGNILRKVGGAVIREVIPGGGLVIEAINAVLPQDKHLPLSATGTQAQAAINSLPPEQQVLIMAKELEVELAEIAAWAQVVDSLARADETGNSTRPRIAVMMAQVTAFAVIAATSAWATAILMGKTATLKELNDSWPLVVAILATPTALLRSYFGMRSDEKKARYAVATGHEIPASGLAGALTNVFKRQW